MTFKACWHSRVITGGLKDLPDSPLISPLPSYFEQGTRII